MRPSSTFRDPDEQHEPRPQGRLQDAISATLGQTVFVRSHRFEGMTFRTPLGRSAVMPVSRFYLQADPPVVVDFRKEVRHGREELALKVAFCRAHGYRYVLAEDEWDGEAAVMPEPDTERPATGTLVTAPRNV